MNLVNTQSLCGQPHTPDPYGVFQSLLHTNKIDEAIQLYKTTPDLKQSTLHLPTYDITKALRLVGDHAKSYYYYILAKKDLVKRDHEQLKAKYDSLLDFEGSIIWFYVSPKEDVQSYGLHLSRKVLQNPATSDNDAKCIHDNLMFYTRPLGGTIVHRAPTVFKDGWYYTTPTFLSDEIFYRVVNYQIAENGAYIIHDPENIVKTINVWESKGVLNMKDNLQLKSPIRKAVQGLEDIRLTNYRGEIYGIGSSWEYHQHERGVVQVFFKLQPESLDIEVLAVLSDGTRCEKNWCWLAFPYIVYNWYPSIRILELHLDDPSNIHVSTFKEISSSPLLRFARGSSNAVLFGNQYWVLVHSVIDGRTPIRRYLHQFVVLNSSTYGIEDISNPFTFEHDADIEFCTALQVDSSAVTVAYSVRDGTPRFQRVEWRQVWSLFPVSSSSSRT